MAEPKASCSLLLSAFSIVSDFLVFAATEPRSRSHPHTRAEYVFYNLASLFSDVSPIVRLPRKSRFLTHTVRKESCICGIHIAFSDLFQKYDIQVPVQVFLIQPDGFCQV